MSCNMVFVHQGWLGSINDFCNVGINETLKSTTPGLS